ncbi:conjugal transfer protein, partial [Streptomyces sp. NPDC089919]|uniref:conjugal transfer protein n=1 Tax=Streptomyces sp. NPDC089919 TaxID=3155188 RepID=UPI00341E0959
EAGARLAAGPGTAPGPTTPGGPAPWVQQEERSGAVFARRLGRGLLWSVVALATVTGLRSWFLPDRAPRPAAPPAPAAAPAYPAAEAQALAARFARAYLTFDPARPGERAALLATALPAQADPALGWDGHGSQSVLAVEPGAVTPGTPGPPREARVRVDVLVRAGGGPARWLGLDVPVAGAPGRLVVRGRPGLVGIPAGGPATGPGTPEPPVDAALTAQTAAAVAAFFTAYADGTADTVTAPGTSLPPLPAGIAFTALTAWSADRGGGPDRSGTARVTWSLAGAALEQAYRVELTRVASADAARWQVAAVRGGAG